MIRNLYSCAMQDLYNACRTLNNALRTYLTFFTAFKASYTTAFCDDFDTAINDAEEMPDMQARDARTESGSEQLKDQGEVGIDLFNKLEGYIEDAFPTEIKLRKEEAGKKYYTKAANHSPGDLQALLNSADAFITAHADVLATDGNMPATFPALVTACKINVRDIYTAFKSSQLENQVQGANKVIANNALFTTATKICADGQRVFRNDEVLKALFVWDKILGMSGQDKIAGIRGHVTNSVTHAPIAKVLIQTVNHYPVYTTQTDEEGHYQMPLAAGDLVFEFSHQDFITATKTITIHTGVTSSLNVALEATAQNQNQTQAPINPGVTEPAT